MRRWIDAAREDVRTHRRLRLLRANGRSQAGTGAFSCAGATSAQFESWSRESGLALTEFERGYLATSIEEREAAELPRKRAARARPCSSDGR